MSTGPYEIVANPRIDQMEIEEDVVKTLSKFGITTAKEVIETPLHMMMGFGLRPSQIRLLKQRISMLLPEFQYVPEFDISDIAGLGESLLKDLRKKGVSVNLVENTSLNELVKVYGIPEDIAVYLQEYVRNNLRKDVFISALDILQERQTIGTITTGCEALDEITLIPELGSGGIRVGETTEFFGSARTGKTQFCLQLCVTVQLPREQGGRGKRAIFIDTEGTFAPSRIIQIANGMKKKYSWDKPVREILQDIDYAKVTHSDEQKNVVRQLLTNLGDDIGLIVIDSISSLFRSEYNAAGIAKRQQSLNEHLNALYRLAVAKKVAVVVTNQVMSAPEQVLGNTVRAVGGNIIGHWAHTRFFLSTTGRSRTVSIFDSPALPELQTTYRITTEGIV